MKNIQYIRTQLRLGKFEFSRSSLYLAANYNISEREIREAGENVIIIEEYPEDKYSPSRLLLLGWTGEGRPLRLQVSPKKSDLTRIITLHKPSDRQWLNYYQQR